jgi:hypothetical protein
MSCAQLNPKQASDNVFNSKSKHESAKYYFRLATIDCSNCDRGGWLRNRPWTACGHQWWCFADNVWRPNDPVAECDRGNQRAPGPRNFERSMDQFRTAYSHGLAWSRCIDRILDVRVLQLSQRLAFDQKVGWAVPQTQSRPIRFVTFTWKYCFRFGPNICPRKQTSTIELLLCGLTADPAQT